MKHRSFLPFLFSVIMLLFVVFLIWYLPSVGQRRFMLEDVRKSLETSQGRERKQQYEYDETVAALPEVQAELDRIIPLSEAAGEEVKALKEERKQLRNELKELQSETVPAVSEEVTDHE